MVMLAKVFAAVAFTATLSVEVAAHPGASHDLGAEIAARNEFLLKTARSVSTCNASGRKRGMDDKHVQRRQAAIVAERARRGLPLIPSKRNTLTARNDALTTSHLSSMNVTSSTSEDIIFANPTCLLNPEGEEGPYYVKGEYIRSNISESEAGVPVIWDLNFIDVATCEPFVGLTADIWHCNATGVYAGVVATGNGNTDDAENIDKTFLRGLQTSDSDGVVQFSSIFPGYYSGRTTHVHMEAHLNGTILANGTYSGGTVAHIGQFFFDQSLITAVNELSPYSKNTNTITENSDDRIVANELTNESDPFMEYVMLGDSVEDGLFMWITIGVDTTASYTSSPAAVLTADGGVEEDSSSGSGPGGMAGTAGNGSVPGGNMVAPEGSPSVTSAVTLVISDSAMGSAGLVASLTAIQSSIVSSAASKRASFLFFG